jgi:phosphoglycolate phosphatase-like HAD superfamily hydrolase
MTTTVANFVVGLLVLLASGMAFAAPWGKISGRACVVVDIDNTLVDTRARTRAAATAFARQNPGLGALASLPLSRIGYDGRATARALGLDRNQVEAFHAHWERFFWKPQNFRHDRPIRQTVQLARQAKAAGAEVYYLTGRIESLKPTTLSQLRRLGLPDADRAHVLCKPSIAVDTAQFKRRAVQGLLKNGHRIGWFMSDSRRDIKAVQGLIPARSCVLVDFPVQPAGKSPRVQPGTSVLRLR